VGKEKLKGSEIKGKTIGIIGFGNVGRRFAEICQVLGLKVLVVSKSFASCKRSIP
jgi:D-3-phosphoglycerate dehydrogenase